MLGLRSPVENRVEVDASPDEVWAVISDPRTYPSWLVGAQRIRGVDPAFPAPGSEFHHSVGPASAATIDDTTEAAGAAPPHRLDLKVNAGPFHAAVELLVLPGPRGSEIRFTERPLGPWALATPALRPILHLRNAESLRRLERLLREGDRADATLVEKVGP